MSKRLDFDKKIKAQLYAREKAVCASCGTDLWRFRTGMCPLAEMDWADHIRPAAKGGGNSIDNGACVCYTCNSKKGDNSRDKEYSFLEGQPSGSYLGRFDQVNPLVEAALRANSKVHWTDWYFNRAICNMDFGVSQLRLAKGNRQTIVRNSAHYAKVTFNFVKEWHRRRKPEAVSHPRERGLIPELLEPDQQILLQMFEATSEQDILELQEALLPYYAGHHAFFLLKAYCFEDAALSQKLVALMLDRDLETSLWGFLNAEEVRDHSLIDEMVDDHLAVVHGGVVAPNPEVPPPVLPRQRTLRLLRSLERYHGLSISGRDAVESVVPVATL